MKFTQWQELAKRVNSRVKTIYALRREKALRLCDEYDLPMDLCCLHNASIADPGKGWGSPPENIKNARRILRIIENFEPSHIADRILARAWKTVA